MSKDNTNQLIDDRELRAALQPWSPDRDTFEADVRRRLEAAQRQLDQKTQRDDPRSQQLEESPWLQVAASVVPLPLLGTFASGGASVPLGKLSFGYKLVGWVALPAVGLLLMVGATIFGLLRIRQAQRWPQSAHRDVVVMESAIAGWWKRFGLLNGLLCVLALALMFLGYALPVYIVFLSSGVAMISLVTRLGRAGMIERQAVAGSLLPGLAMLAQLVQLYTIPDSGVHLLDQLIILAVLYGAAVVIAILMIFANCSHGRAAGSAFGVIAIVGVLMVGYFSNTIWHPVTTATLKNYVESFDKARFQSGSWQLWSVPAGWLRDSGVSLDLAKPRELLQLEIAGDQNPLVLGIAFNNELIVPNDLTRLRGLDANRMRILLLDANLRGLPISSIQSSDYTIRALTALGELTETERDLLESRLLATLREVSSVGYNELVDALVTTKLLITLDRTCEDKSIHESVRRLLVSLQRVRFYKGLRQGGFAASRTLDFSDRRATAAAVELMQLYGVPAGVDIMSLRSYLRPSANDYWMTDQAAVRIATKQRIESLPTIPPLGWWDYLRYEPNLWMSLMVVALCFYATLGCVKRGTEVRHEPSRNEPAN